MLARRVIFFALPIYTALLPAAAQADCYDVFGCADRTYFRAADLADGPNCDFLYTMRNTIYKQHGYCFTTQRAIALFGNAGCLYDDVGQVPLNTYERANVATILSVERAEGCPR